MVWRGGDAVGRTRAALLIDSPSSESVPKALVHVTAIMQPMIISIDVLVEVVRGVCDRDGLHRTHRNTTAAPVLCFDKYAYTAQLLTR